MVSRDLLDINFGFFDVDGLAGRVRDCPERILVPCVQNAEIAGVDDDTESPGRPFRRLLEHL